MLSAASDISHVPPDFVKWFMVMFFALLSAVGTGFVAYRKGKQASGTSDEPVNIKSPITIKKMASYAHKRDLEKLAKAVAKASAAGEERRVEIIHVIHEMEQRIGRDMKPVAEMVMVHEALIAQINNRLLETERSCRDGKARLQQSINDSIRIATEHRKQS